MSEKLPCGQDLGDCSASIPSACDGCGNKPQAPVPSPLIGADTPGEAPHLPWREALDIANAEIATLRAQLAEERAKHEGWNDSDEELYQWAKSENRRAHPAPDATALREAARGLLNLMDEVPIDPALGDETDRVFSHAEFEPLRKALGGNV